jgi:hypothetical protein
MATPSWSDKVSVVALTRVTNGNSARGTLTLTNKFGGYIFMRVGRLTNTAPATGIKCMIRRILYDSGNSRDIPHPSTLAVFQDGLTAANLTTLSATPTFPASAVTLTTATSFAGDQSCCIVDSTSAPTRAEWQRSSKLASSTLTFDRNLANTSIASGDTITNQAFVMPPVWFDGTPNNGDIEVIFDYGVEANGSHVVVEAWAQTLDSVA